jgi:hypothetical protein
MGFSRLYEDIMSGVLNPTSSIWEYVNLYLLVNYFLTAFFISNAYLIKTNLDWGSFIAANFFLMAAVFIMLYSWTIIWNAWGVSRKRKFAAEKLLLNLFFFQSHPFMKDKKGLKVDDFERLKNVAEVEQSAADWRGNIYNATIIAIAAVVASTYNAVAENFSLPLPLLQGSSTELLATLALIPVFMVGLLAFWVSYRFAFSLHEFLAREPINRVIINLCLEAKNILESEGLADFTDVDFEKKKWIVAYLGFELISENLLETFALKNHSLRKLEPDLFIVHENKKHYIVVAGAREWVEQEIKEYETRKSLMRGLAFKIIRFFPWLGSHLLVRPIRYIRHHLPKLRKR